MLGMCHLVKQESTPYNMTASSYEFIINACHVPNPDSNVGSKTIQDDVQVA